MIITTALEAARYKRQLPHVARFLTHSFDTKTLRPLCKRVQSLSTYDPAFMHDAPTCTRCYAKDPRFGNKATGKAKLNLEQVTEIRRRFAKGAKASDIAREYKITVGHACNIRDGRVWPKSQEPTHVNG
jgi:hypothetical protein